jgi:hypothetical protein
MKNLAIQVDLSTEQPPPLPLPPGMGGEGQAEFTFAWGGGFFKMSTLVTQKI